MSSYRGPQPSECDAAVWLPLAHVDALLAESGTGFSDAVSDDTVRQYAPAAGSPADAPVGAARLCGVYPNACAEGIGRGHVFALRHLTRRRRKVAGFPGGSHRGPTTRGSSFRGAR